MTTLNPASLKFGHVPPPRRVLVHPKQLEAHFQPLLGEQRLEDVLEIGPNKPDMKPGPNGLLDLTEYYRTDGNRDYPTKYRNKPPGVMGRRELFAPLALLSPRGEDPKDLVHGDLGSEDSEAAPTSSLIGRRPFIIGTSFLAILASLGLRPKPASAQVPAAPAPYDMQKIPPSGTPNPMAFTNYGNLNEVPAAHDAIPLSYTPRNVTNESEEIAGWGNLKYFDAWENLQPDSYFEFQYPNHHRSNGGQFLYTNIRGNNFNHYSTVGEDYLTAQTKQLHWLFEQPTGQTFPELHVLAKLGAEGNNPMPPYVDIVVTSLNDGSQPIKDSRNPKRQVAYRVNIPNNGKKQFYFRIHPDDIFLKSNKPFRLSFLAPTISGSQQLQVRTRVYSEWPETPMPAGEPAN